MINDPTQNSGVDIFLETQFNLTAALNTPATGFGTVGYVMDVVVVDVSGVTPQPLQSQSGIVSKNPGGSPLINGFNPSDVSCVGDSCNLDTTILRTLAMPNGATISFDTSASGFVSVFNSPGETWEVISNNTSKFIFSVNATANPNATLTLIPEPTVIVLLMLSSGTLLRRQPRRL